MFTVNPTLLAVLLVSGGGMGGQPAANPLALGPLLGYVHDGKVYAFRDYRYSHSARPPCLVEAALGPVAEGRAPARYVFHPHIYNSDSPCRWRIAHGSLWAGACDATVSRVPLSDLDLCDPSNPKAAEQAKARYPQNSSKAHFFYWRMDPVLDLDAEINHLFERKLSRLPFGSKEKVERLPDPYADVLPVGRESVLLFLLHQRHCVVRKGTFKWEKTFWPDGPRWVGKWEERPEEVISVGYFHQPFMVFAAGEDYFFATRSCQLYVAAKAAVGIRRAEPWWLKADEPIGRIITDADTGRVFAFTAPLVRKDGSKAKPVYFELAREPEARAYDPAKFPPSKEEYPLNEIRACVDLLLAEGMIASPKGAPK